MKNMNIYLPLFSWFYNTPHDFNDSNIIDDMKQSIDDEEGGYYETLSEEDIKKVKELSWDSYSDLFDIFDKYYEIDYKQYRKDYWSEYVSNFNNELGEDLKNIWIYNIKFNHISSPQYYNYWNDEIDVSVEYDFDKLISFLNTNTEKFSKYIESHNTSYDWFIPFWTNNVEEYISKTEFEPFEITQIIHFYISEIKDEDINDITNFLLEDTQENIYEYEYVKEKKLV